MGGGGLGAADSSLIPDAAPYPKDPDCVSSTQATAGATGPHESRPSKATITGGKGGRALVIPGPLRFFLVRIGGPSEA